MTITRSFTHAIATALCTAALFTAASVPSLAEGSDQKPPATAEKLSAPLNLNTASAAELEKLPGVGASVANRIIEYRQKNGGFKKIEDLMNVRGIGEKTFLKLKPMITLAPAKTTGL